MTERRRVERIRGRSQVRYFFELHCYYCGRIVPLGDWSPADERKRRPKKNAAEHGALGGVVEDKKNATDAAPDPAPSVPGRQAFRVIRGGRS